MVERLDNAERREARRLDKEEDLLRRKLFEKSKAEEKAQRMRQERLAYDQDRMVRIAERAAVRRGAFEERVRRQTEDKAAQVEAKKAAAIASAAAFRAHRAALNVIAMTAATKNWRETVRNVQAQDAIAAAATIAAAAAAATAAADAEDKRVTRLDEEAAEAAALALKMKELEEKAAAEIKRLEEEAADAAESDRLEDERVAAENATEQELLKAEQEKVEFALEMDRQDVEAARYYVTRNFMGYIKHCDGTTGDAWKACVERVSTYDDWVEKAKGMGASADCQDYADGPDFKMEKAASVVQKAFRHYKARQVVQFLRSRKAIKEIRKQSNVGGMLERRASNVGLDNKVRPFSTTLNAFDVAYVMFLSSQVATTIKKEDITSDMLQEVFEACHERPRLFSDLTVTVTHTLLMLIIVHHSISC
jgi:hypothetical protein